MEKIGWKSSYGWVVVLFFIAFLGLTHVEAWGLCRFIQKQITVLKF